MAVAHRIYAQALLEAAQDKGRLERVREEFDDFAAALADSEELRDLLRNPQIDARAKAAALEAALGEADELFRNFLRLTAEKGRVGEVDEIYAEWQRLLAREERVLTLDLATALELSDEEAESIVAEIAKATGRRVEATRSVDPSLIGGIVLQAGSLRLDASVRGRLDQLRDRLVTT